MITKIAVINFENVFHRKKTIKAKIVKLEKSDLKKFGSRYGAYGEIIYLFYDRISEEATNLLVINEQNTGGFMIVGINEIEDFKYFVERGFKTKGYAIEYPDEINKKYKNENKRKLCFKLTKSNSNEIFDTIL